MAEHNIELILVLSLLIWVSPFIAKAIRTPTAPIEIILGSSLAFVGLLPENELFDLIAEVGFLYLMFLAGLEVNLKQITKGSKEIINRAILFVITVGVLAGLMGWLLDMSIIEIISLPLISMGLIASLIKIYGKKEPWLKLSITVGIIGEIASIATLTILDAVSTVGFGWELAVKLFFLFFFIVFIVFIYWVLKLLFWWYPELKKKLIPQLDNSEQDIRLAMALFFILIAVMVLLDLELALGAFIAGVAISAFFYHEKELEEKLSSLGFGFLVPIFFIHVGASFDLEALQYKGVVIDATIFTVVAIAIRVISAFHLRRIYSKTDALIASFALSMPLTLIIAVATIGYDSGNIGLLTYYTLILSSLFEVIISMFAIKILNNRLKEIRRQAFLERERRVARV